MIMSSFRSSPRKRHIDRLKQIYSYVSKTRHADIRIRTMELDLSALPEASNTWDQIIHGTVKKHQRIFPDH